MASALTAGGAVLGASAAMAWAVRGRSSSVFGPSVWHGDRRRAAVALTFDDGPSEATPRLLEILAARGARATFFQCGAHVDRLPEVARAVRAAGHEIGNHSYSHPYFCFRGAAFMEAQLARAQRSIADATGAVPTLMRAPYGVRWPGLGSAQRRLGLLGVMWTVLGRDWKLDAAGIVERVAPRLANGCIVCLHDGRGLEANPRIDETLEAVRRLLPIIDACGLAPETVTEFLQTPEPPNNPPGTKRFR